MDCSLGQVDTGLSKKNRILGLNQSKNTDEEDCYQDECTSVQHVFNKIPLSVPKQNKMKEKKNKVSHCLLLICRPGYTQIQTSTPSDKTPINSSFFAAAWATVCVFTYLLFLFCCILLVDHIHTLSKYRNPAHPPTRARLLLLSVTKESLLKMWRRYII